MKIRGNTITILQGSLPLEGGTMAGPLDMGGYSITGIPAPVNSSDAVRKTDLDTKLSLSGGTMTGTLSMNSKSIINLKEPTNNTDAATKKYVDDAKSSAISSAVDTAVKDAGTNADTLVKNAAKTTNSQLKIARPRNVLTNSDWRGKDRIINQRGATTYDAAGYTIDRWVKIYSRPNVTVNDGYLAIANNSTSDTYRLYQRLLKGTLTAGTKYTAVIKIHNGSVFSAVLEAPSSGDKSSSRLNSSLYLGIGKSDVMDTFYIAVSSSTTINVDWVALYEGEYTADTIPEYQYKGHAAELHECMLYFQTIKSAGSAYFTPIGFGWGTSSGVGRCAIPLSAPMREGVVASIEHTFTGMYLFDGSENSISEITVVNSTSRVPTNVVVVDATASGLDHRAPCTFVVTGGELWLSKDL